MTESTLFHAVLAGLVAADFVVGIVALYRIKRSWTRPRWPNGSALQSYKPQWCEWHREFGETLRRR